ncbi:MAG: hypothetical protein K6E83_09215 [Clostridium sp.]|nr:hypothetical protein [Clostridium sp.]
MGKNHVTALFLSQWEKTTTFKTDNVAWQQPAHGAQVPRAGLEVWRQIRKATKKLLI